MQGRGDPVSPHPPQSTPANSVLEKTLALTFSSSTDLQRGSICDGVWAAACTCFSSAGSGSLWKERGKPQGEAPVADTAGDGGGHAT